MSAHLSQPSRELPRAARTLLAGVAILLSAPLAAQQAYKWKDAAGVTHFTSDPPPAGQHYEVRDVDHRQAAAQATPEPSADEAPAQRRGEDPACATARGNLALLEGKAPVTVDSDGDGKPDQPLSDEDRIRQRNLAQAIIDAKCRGDDAAPPSEAASEPAPEPEGQ